MGPRFEQVPPWVQFDTPLFSNEDLLREVQKVRAPPRGHCPRGTRPSVQRPQALEMPVGAGA